MRFIFFCINLFSFVFAQNIPYQVPFSLQEIPQYQKDSLETFALKMDYGRWQIHQAQAWKKISSNYEIVAVDLVFTKQPVDYSFWKTPYYQLMKNRLDALYYLEPRLRKKHDIPWRIYLQTHAQTKAEAQALFHGFVLHIKPKGTKLIQQPTITHHSEVPPNRLTVNGDTIKHFKLQYKNFELTKRVIQSTVQLKDSIVVSVLDSNHWESMNVIMDWTGSMYPYSAQVLRWYYRHISTKAVRCLTLFNDGDDWLQENPLKRVKKLGEAGGIYHVMNPDSINEVLDAMEECMMNGDGFEPEENDCEAILAAINECPDSKNIILIADNSSAVRDLRLMNQIKKPVHIILCGTTRNKILRDYVTLAWKTGGSVHSNLGSYTFKSPEEPLETLIIGTVEFIFNPTDKIWDWKLNNPKTW